MSENGKSRRRSVPTGEYYARKMKEPDFRREYEALSTEFENVEQIIARRIAHGMTQSDLAWSRSDARKVPGDSAASNTRRRSKAG